MPKIFVPEQFICPLSQAIMDNPVRTALGKIYEFAAIDAWLKSNDTDPLSQQKMPSKKLIPQAMLKHQLGILKEKYSLCSFEQFLQATKVGDCENLEKKLLYPQFYLHKPDENGLYAIHWAAKNGYTAIVLSFAKGNTELLDLADPKGWTALHWAAYQNQSDVAKVLLDLRADILMQDRDGNSPVDIAKNQGHGKLADFLINYDRKLEYQAKRQFIATQTRVSQLENRLFRRDKQISDMKQGLEKLINKLTAKALVPKSRRVNRHSNRQANELRKELVEILNRSEIQSNESEPVSHEIAVDINSLISLNILSEDSIKIIISQLLEDTTAMDSVLQLRTTNQFFYGLTEAVSKQMLVKRNCPPKGFYSSEQEFLQQESIRARQLKIFLKKFTKLAEVNKDSSLYFNPSSKRSDKPFSAGALNYFFQKRIDPSLTALNNLLPNLYKLERESIGLNEIEGKLIGLIRLATGARAYEFLLTIIDYVDTNKNNYLSKERVIDIIYSCAVLSYSVAEFEWLQQQLPIDIDQKIGYIMCDYKYFVYRYEPLLHHMIAAANLSLVKHWLSQGADIYATGDQKMTAIEYAKSLVTKNRDSSTAEWLGYQEIFDSLQEVAQNSSKQNESEDKAAKIRKV